MTHRRQDGARSRSSSARATCRPPGLDLPADAKLPDSLVFRDASSRDVFTAHRRASPASTSSSTRRSATQPLTIDLRNATLDDALTAVSASTRTFYRVTAPRTMTIVPDTPAKRREYEEEVVRTFYLCNADLKETIDLLRIVVDARQISPITGTNAITIKDTPERIAAAGKLIAAIDKARPEVVIDVELLEVDRTRLQEYGLQIASPGSAGHRRRGRASTSRDLTLRDLQTLTVRRRLPDDPAGALLPAAQDRRQHAHAGQPAAADVGGHRRAGEVRRARAGAGHHVSRRSPPAASTSSRSPRSTTRTSASTSTSRRGRTTTTRCRWR